MRIAIPVKPFAEAKQRLAGELDAATRENLARTLFRHVFAVAAEFAGARSILAVSRSAEILQYAQENGATGLPEGPVAELNAALATAAAHARAEGAPNFLVIASDLPLLAAQDLALLAEAGCAIAADRHKQGTNALAWPTAPQPGFHFGEGSFARHRAAARECGLFPRLVTSSGLGHDVDSAEDLIGSFKPSAKPPKRNAR